MQSGNVATAAREGARSVELGQAADEHMAACIASAGS
jgi:hypothetical protein